MFYRFLFPIIFINIVAFSQAPELKIDLASVSPVNAIAISAGENLMISALGDMGKQGRCVIWDLTTGKPLKSFIPQTYSLSALEFTANGSGVLLGGYDNLITLYDVNSTQAISTFKGHTLGVMSIKVTQNGRFFASLGMDKKIIVWDINRGKALKEIAVNSTYVSSFDISADGSQIIYATLEGPIVGYNVVEGKEIFRLNEWNTDPNFAEKMDKYAIGSIGALKFTHDGTQIYATHGDKIILWDINSKLPIKRIKTEIPMASFMEISQNTNEIFIGEFNGKKVEVFSLESGDRISSFIPHLDNLSGLFFSTTGNVLLTAGKDGRIKLWDYKKPEEIISIISIDSTDWVVAAPTGEFEATGNALPVLYFVAGLEIIPLESLFEQFYTPGLLFEKFTLGSKSNTGQKRLTASVEPPPAIKILSPADKTEYDIAEETIVVEISDQGGGINEFRLYHNGKLIHSKKYDKNPGKKVKEAVDVKLLSGENVFRASAFSTSRLEAFSETISLDLEAPAPESDLYILAVAVNSYKNKSYNLNYARSDAEAFVAEIPKVSGKIFKNIIVKTLYDDQAVLKNIQKEFDEIASKAKSQDMFIFYFSGHGVSDANSDNTGYDYFFLLHDVDKKFDGTRENYVNCLTGSELKEITLKLKPLKQLMLIDACNSGEAVNVFASRGFQEEKAIVELSRSRGVYIIAASGASQTAKEVTELKHGLFTYSIIEGLRCYSDIFVKDKVVTVKELNFYIENRVKELVEKYKLTNQRPVSWEYLNDFPIAVCD